MSKKRLLFCGESALNRTGYSSMALQLLTRLSKTGKYEIAELATYAKPEDPRLNYLPWKVYPVIPAEGNQAEQEAYNSRPDSQFGSWKFEQVCLDFMPDIVIDWRDNQWMSTYQLMSPLRPYYSILWMPTIDAYPQMDDWINQYSMADRLLTYSNFGFNVLKNSIAEDKLLYVASPGVNFEDFKILDKKEIRAKYEIPENIILLGMVARNQLRKLYPDILRMFRIFLDKAPKEQADNTYLHLHLGFPDQGWDIPKLLKETGLSHKVYFTYICRACSKVTINKWNDYKLNCPKCSSRESTFFTNPSFGVTENVLCEIYNLYDLYIQYAALEGMGIPILEAAACGVPTCVVPYSAMEDFVTTLESFPIKIAKYVTEDKSHRIWAYPDNEDFADKLTTLLKKNLLEEWGKRTRELCKQYYNWDDGARLWEYAIDYMPKAQKDWNAPKIQENTGNVDNNAPDNIFIKQCLSELALSPHLSSGLLYSRFSRDLYNGFVQDGHSNPPFTRQHIIESCSQIRNAVLFWDNERCKKVFST